jgi:hypothetical protein
VTPRWRGWSHTSDSWLDRDLHVVEVDFGEQPQLDLGRLHQRFGSCPAVLLVQAGIEGPGVHADADGHAAVPAFAGYELDLLRLAQVAGVEAEALHPCFKGGQRHLHVEVDVGDDRHRGAGDDPSQPLGRLLLVARAAHDVGPGSGQRVDLGQRAVDIGGLGDRHRLHGDWGVATDGNVADLDLPGRLAGSGDHGSKPKAVGRCRGTAR